ncbi:hypothetical protein TSAR_004321, partial [Trichomalopsis sarcophagae]
MARCWLHQRWWWLLLVLFAGLSRLGYCQKPSATAAAAAGTTTTTTGPTPQAAITSPRIVVFLREQCDGELNSTELLQELQRGYASAIGMVSKAETCEVRSWGLEALVQALSQKTTKALVAQLDYNTCEVAAKLAHLWNKSLITWTCPQ